ncbi:hypothetical protein QP166_10295 [Sphingomonas sp. LR60]|uniref:hypothetical protein n=1 Tax=Sphingomonas sp. LR60 TaxID=3050233 RepID=UPI002FE0C9D2
MKIASMFAAAASLTLAAAPALAAPAASPAASLSIAKSARASTATSGKSKLGAPGSIVALVLAAAIVAGGVFIAVDDNNSDSN